MSIPCPLCGNSSHSGRYTSVKLSCKMHYNHQNTSYFTRKNYSKCSPPLNYSVTQMYNELKNTNNLKLCNIHTLCAVVASISAQFSVAVREKGKCMAPLTVHIVIQILIQYMWNSAICLKTALCSMSCRTTTRSVLPYIIVQPLDVSCHIL